MADNQIDLVVDGFVGAVGGNGQASHDFLNRPIRVADKQADIVPVFGQSCGGVRIEEFTDIVDVGHIVFNAGCDALPFYRIINLRRMSRTYWLGECCN